MQRAQTTNRNVPVVQPATEVFSHQEVMADAAARVPSRLQIQGEPRENYAKVAARHAATNGSTREEMPHEGEI